MTRGLQKGGSRRAAALALLLLAAPGCGGIRQLPLGTNSFANSRAAVEEALAADEVDRAVERARAFERRFPGEVADGLMGEALWRSGRLNEAEGFLRRAAEAGDARGRLGMARVAISRGRWQQARRWAEAAGAGPKSNAVLLTIALARGDAAAARETAAPIGGPPAGDDPVGRLAAAIAADGAPGAWQGPPGPVSIRAAPGGWLVDARFAGRPVRLRLALEDHRSWIRRDLVAAATPDGEPGAAAAEDDRLVSGTLTLGPLRRERALLEVRTAPPGDAPVALDGVLGADLLVDLRWSLDPRAPSLVVAPDEGLGWDAPAPSAAALEVLRPPPAGEVQWLSVRVLRNGLDVQWFLMPRIETPANDARTMASVLDWERDSVIDDDALADLGAEAGDSGVATRVRLGSWWPPVRLRAADLSPLAAGGRVAPRLSVGSELFRDWRLLWDPGARQLGLVPEPTVAGKAGPGRPAPFRDGTRREALE